MRLAVAGIVASFITSAACAQTLSLHAGESVTVRFDSGKPVVEKNSSVPPIGKFEAYVIWRAQSQAVPPGAKTIPPEFIKKGEGPPDAPRPSGEQLRITMRWVPGIRPGSPDSTILIIENGYDLALRYHAAMRSGTRSRPTDVCDAAPHRLGLEHWPFRIEELDLSDLQLIAFTGDVQCA